MILREAAGADESTIGRAAARALSRAAGFARCTPPPSADLQEVRRAQ